MGRKADWRVVGGLAAWVTVQLAMGRVGFTEAAGWSLFLSEGLLAGIAGGVVLGCAAGAGLWRVPGRREWAAVVLLTSLSVAGMLLGRPYVDAVLHVHHAKAGAQQVVLLAAPMWLALQGALRLVPEEVPRRTVGAVLMAIAGYCLLLGNEQMSVAWIEVPALTLTVVQVLALVVAWSWAKRVFAEWPTVTVAGWALLVTGVTYGTVGWLVVRPEAQELQGREVWSLLAASVVLTGLGGVLWWLLLLRMELPAFAMQWVAVWLGSLGFAFAMFGFLNWRVDLATALGALAMRTALRASLEDDAPVRLGVV